MEQFIGKQLGNYDILELVGKGGMAAVYKAHQPSFNRSVAIKVMSAAYGNDDQFVQRFKNEAHLIAQLEHAHILPVYDFGEQDGVLFIVMRLLSAGTLGDRIPEGGMPIKQIARYFRQLASALDYAHSHKVIHRDLKPGNVMIDQQENIYLTDFGIAKLTGQDNNLTGTGGVVGTPTYMSPEQGLGDPLDGRSDIYALGVMLFEMLVGKPPFTADNPMAVMLKHINDAPPSIRSIRAEVSQAVEAVVMRSLAKDPNERYSTALEMADALDEAISTGAVPQAAAAFTEPSSTLSGMKAAAPAVSPGASTMQSPIAGAAAGTAEFGAAGVTGAAVPMPQVAMPSMMPEIIPIQFNSISDWLKRNTWVGTWSQAILLSLSTFLILARLTQNAIPEIAAISLLPGIVYGLLRAPTLGALISMVLVLIPLAARAPALAVLWFVLVVVAGSRLNSREMMLTLVTIIAAGNPLGWLVPLLAPWWLKARRSVLPVALGVTFATLFTLTINWPNAMGLLPAQPDEELAETALIGDFDTTYFGLLEPSAWEAWTENPAQVVEGMLATFNGLGNAFADTAGLPLVLAAGWALAAVLSVSNQHSERASLRALGIALGLGILLVTNLVLRSDAGVEMPSPLAMALGVAGAGLAFLLSQWPVQADPNTGNKIGTLLRMLRNAMGALFMALGVAFFAQFLQGTPFYNVFWVGGIAGTLTMITNPLVGPAIVFAALVGGLVGVNPVLAIVVGALFMGYLVVNLLFDKRRPRNWNPLGAGFILGSPGMALAGILPLGPLAIGALEAQVPAAILATMGHVLLIAMIAPGQEGLAFPIVVQLVTTLFGVLLVERVMATSALDMLHPRLRRLAFTCALALIMAIGYFGLGVVDLTVGSMANLGIAVVVSVLSAAALVAAMGKRAEFWREFVEKEESEAEEFEDEEVTGVAKKARAK